MIAPILRTMTASPTAADRRRGLLVAGGTAYPCALGRCGPVLRKREGDGGTPIGRWRAVEVLYRPDRVRRPATRLPVSTIDHDDGWCDDPADRNYNRWVSIPYPASHERLWRDDDLYDVLVVLDYNLRYPRPGAGSAIFLHLAAPGFTPTAGCVAVAPSAMRRILARMDAATELVIR